LNDENGKWGRGGEPAMICCGAQFLMTVLSPSERIARSENGTINILSILFGKRNGWPDAPSRRESMAGMRGFAHSPARSMGLPAAAGRIGFRS
jgi:hypothetical protein